MTEGNKWRLTLTLKELVKINGVISEREIDIKSGSTPTINIYPSGSSTAIASALSSSSRSGATFYLVFSHGLETGQYDLEITGLRSNDYDFRYYKKNQFVIVETTNESYVPDYMIMEYVVDATIGVGGGSSSGGSASVGTLNTTSETALSTSSSESFGGTINLHKVSKTGNYNDLLNKPTIPDAQVNADWNATEGKAVILNKPTIPSLTGYATKSWVNDALEGFITIDEHEQDLQTAVGGKEDKVTFDTLSGASVSPALGKYYVMSNVGTLTITLPSVSDMTYQQGFQIFMTTGSSVAISFSENVYLPDGFSFEANSAYELNFIKNSVGWIIGVSKFVASNS